MCVGSSIRDVQDMEDPITRQTPCRLVLGTVGPGSIDVFTLLHDAICFLTAEIDNGCVVAEYVGHMWCCSWCVTTRVVSLCSQPLFKVC